MKFFCETQSHTVHWLSSSIFTCLFGRSSVRMVTSPFISTVWCFRPYKPYIFWKFNIWWWQWLSWRLTKKQIQWLQLKAFSIAGRTFHMSSTTTLLAEPVGSDQPRLPRTQQVAFDTDKDHGNNNIGSGMSKTMRWSISSVPIFSFHSSLNFLIYFGFSRKFQQDIGNLIRKGRINFTGN